ncbi:hypothetical protein HYE67_008633 [Fusarium culmorum]|uniref:Uncharacterized protein n=1 Tax=Fusarium culmorum TaxID=5516 RepID=A0A2T4H839_FUSCU|nr:hypothetical protein FCULG_00003333 [Fusarium culmorum]QPC66402.1 hypothetical protein HYE67_008633 [Fusarium culmorum]
MDSLKQSKKSDKGVPSLWTRLQLGYIARSIRGCLPRLLPGRMRHRRPHIISLDKGSDIGSLRDDKASPDPSEAGLSRACRHGRAESQNEATSMGHFGTLQCPIKHGQSGFAQGIPHPCTYNQSTNVRVIRILGKGASYEADDVRLRHTLNNDGHELGSTGERHTALRHRHTHLTSPGFPRGGPERPLLNLWLDRPAQAEKALCCQSKVRTWKSGAKVYGWRTSIEFCGWRLNF